VRELGRAKVGTFDLDGVVVGNFGPIVGRDGSDGRPL